jgi:hypothetical protein
MKHSERALMGPPRSSSGARHTCSSPREERLGQGGDTCRVRSPAEGPQAGESCAQGSRGGSGGVGVRLAIWCGMHWGAYTISLRVNECIRSNGNFLASYDA